MDSRRPDIDPSDLEAARALLRTRFDLRIGIWDLVANPTLRNTLLGGVISSKAPNETATIPEPAAKRASAAVESRLDTRAKLASISQELSPLRNVGWTDPRSPWELLNLPLTEPLFSKPYGDGMPEALLCLSMEVSKRQTKVSIMSPVLNPIDLGSYISAHEARFREIAEPHEVEFASGWRTLMRAKGGWGEEDVDWPGRATELVGFPRNRGGFLIADGVSRSPAP